MSSDKNFEKLNKFAKSLRQLSADENLCKKAKRSILDSTTSQTQNLPAKRSSEATTIWRTIMKSKITKLATAAAIIIAVILGLHFTGGSIDGASVTWAEMIEPILVARTASFDLTLEMEGQDGQTSQIVCMAPGRIRQTMSNGTIIVVNFEQYKILILNSNEKKATLRELVAESGELSKLDVFGNMQKMLEHMIHFTDESIEVLGIATIDDREASGFRVPITERDKIIGWQGKGTFTVWADTVTKRPVLWEWYDEMYGINTVVSNIELNLELDESLFDVAIPEGYETKTNRDLFKGGSEPVNSTWTNESKVIDGFRSWTTISDGKFPSSLTFNAIKDFNPEASIGLRQSGWGFNIDIKGLSAADFFGEYEPTKEELVELNNNLNKALSGVQTVFFMPAESNWHYAGKGVTTEDVDTPNILVSASRLGNLSHHLW